MLTFLLLVPPPKKSAPDAVSTSNIIVIDSDSDSRSATLAAGPSTPRNSRRAPTTPLRSSRVRPITPAKLRKDLFGEPVAAAPWTIDDDSEDTEYVDDEAKKEKKRKWAAEKRAGKMKALDVMRELQNDPVESSGQVGTARSRPTRGSAPEDASVEEKKGMAAIRREARKMLNDMVNVMKAKKHASGGAQDARAPAEDVAGSSTAPIPSQDVTGQGQGSLPDAPSGVPDDLEMAANQMSVDEIEELLAELQDDNMDFEYTG